MSETFYLPREQQAELAELLYPGHQAPPHIWAASIPSLVEDLAVAIARQDRMGTGMRIRSGSDEQPLPYNDDASRTADELHNELAGWARLVIDQRHIDYDAGNNTIDIARWLKRWIIALAMCEGAETALVDIRKAVKRTRRIIDRPQDPRWMNADQLEASDSRLNARGIEALARELGEQYANLNRDRVRTLHSAGKIQPVHIDEDSDEQYLFRVGDVLAAHLAHPTRRSRKTTAA